MIVNKLYDGIYYYENIIDNSEKIIESIESLDYSCEEYSNISKWSTWTASDDISKIYGLSKSGYFSLRDYRSSSNFDLFKIASTISFSIKFALANYCYLNNIKEPWLPDFFYIKKYDPNVDMGPHVDSDDPTSSVHPILSGVFYLNDDYEGGELHFPNQNITIKPKAGSLIIFPSVQPYIHHPKEVISGNKYMIPLFWFKEKF